MTGGKQEVRSNSKAVTWGRLAGLFSKMVVSTLRVEIEYRAQGPQTDEPRIFCLWHNRMIGGTAAAKFWLAHRPGVVLTSASKDGAMLEAAMKVVGLGAVRGSSHRRGAAALVALARAVREGTHVVVTPDGPKGPIYEVQKGIVKLASVTETPIIPFLVTYKNCWRLKTWDEFQLPVPFSRLKIVFGEEIGVEAGADDEKLEVARKRVEEAMQEGLNWEEQ